MSSLLKAMKKAAKTLDEDRRPAINEAATGGCLLTAQGGETITIPWNDVREHLDQLPLFIEGAVRVSLHKAGADDPEAQAMQSAPQISGELDVNAD